MNDTCFRGSLNEKGVIHVGNQVGLRANVKVLDNARIGEGQWFVREL